MKIKDFEKFLLEEITIKGNPAIPGEGADKDEEKYLSNVERRAKERLGITGQGSGSIASQLKSLLEESKTYTKGKEKQLESLANDIMMGNYGDIIKRYEITLDIKMIKSGKDVKEFMDDIDDEHDEEEKEYVDWIQVKDEDERNEVYKRKIANLIIQGESKNTKHILHSDECKSGLEVIFGGDADKIFKIWDEMSKLADKLDWLLPTDSRANMMKENPEGFAGASGVGWKPKEESEELQEYEEESEEEYTAWTGEEDEEEMYNDYTEEEYIEPTISYTPILKAVGIDFPMLLHESVKGLFEILSLGGIPEDATVANIALSNTGMEDEPEDWKYGPEVARDFRRFLNVNKNIDKYPNIREELYKILIDKNTMPTKEFLKLFKGILSNTDEARRKIDVLINKAIENIEVYNNYLAELDQYEKDMKQYEIDMANFGKSGSVVDDEEIVDIEQVDYSTMNKRELQAEIDAALDSGNYTKVKMLSKYIKESRNNKKYN